MIIRLFKRALRVCAVLLIGGFVALFALTCVFRLQPRRMYENLQSSIYTFRADGQYPYVIRHHDSTMLDNFTDAVMINQAVFSHPDIGPLQRAIYMYSWELPGGRMKKTENLVYLLENEPQDMQLFGYGRYWHGYIAFLRPLLLFFNYEELRIFICMIQIVLIGITVVLLGKRKKFALFIPFVGYILIISPTGTVLSLQYFCIHAITLCACIALLNFAEKRTRLDTYEWFFFVIGMMTSFFDLLTYPVVSFGIPACLMICLRKDDSLKDQLLLFVRCGIMWCVGYLGFWVTKWLLGTWLGGENLLANALWAVQRRTSDQVVEAGLSVLENRSDAILRNLEVLSTRSFYAALAIALSIGVIRRLYCRDIEKPRLATVAPLLIVATIPFIWWWVTANHAYIHYWFTYRSISITVFAVLACLYGERKRQM